MVQYTGDMAVSSSSQLDIWTKGEWGQRGQVDTRVNKHREKSNKTAALRQESIRFENLCIYFSLLTVFVYHLLSRVFAKRTTIFDWHFRIVAPLSCYHWSNASEPYGEKKTTIFNKKHHIVPGKFHKNIDKHSPFAKRSRHRLDSTSNFAIFNSFDPFGVLQHQLSATQRSQQLQGTGCFRSL